MHVVFLMDPLERINPDRDTTFALMLEAQRRGHIVFYAQPRDLYLDHERPRATLFPARVRRGSPHFALEPAIDQPLCEVDVVFMRKDPPVDTDYLLTTYILDRVSQTTLVVNDPLGLKKANEKLYALEFASFVPRSLLTADFGRLRAFLEELGGVMIVKPWDGHNGRGVFRVSVEDYNLDMVLETATAEGRRPVIAQQFVPEDPLGEKRIMMVNGYPRGAIFWKESLENTRRSKLHADLLVQKAELSDRDMAICAALGPALRRDGLLLAGIDVRCEHLIEINVTSPTGIQEIDRVHGVCLEGEVLDLVEVMVQRGGMRLTG